MYYATLNSLMLKELKKKCYTKNDKMIKPRIINVFETFSKGFFM